MSNGKLLFNVFVIIADIILLAYWLSVGNVIWITIFVVLLIMLIPSTIIVYWRR